MKNSGFYETIRANKQYRLGDVIINFQHFFFVFSNGIKQTEWNLKNSDTTMIFFLHLKIWYSNTLVDRMLCFLYHNSVKIAYEISVCQKKDEYFVNCSTTNRNISIDYSLFECYHHFPRLWISSFARFLFTVIFNEHDFLFVYLPAPKEEHTK